MTGSFPRDMVELPSQLNEHWAWEPEVMKHYARDYETGRPIPDALIAKFKESENFLKGLYLTDFYATALLDLEWHTVLRPVEGCDVAAFERAFLKRYDFPEHTLPDDLLQPHLRQQLPRAVLLLHVVGGAGHRCLRGIHRHGRYFRFRNRAPLPPPYPDRSGL